MDLHNIREEYRKKVLSQQECNVNPIIQFEHWLDDAINAQVNEPTGMNLATINENGRPSSRMVLLKEVNAQGFVFFTNYHSRKGLAIEQHPFVALTFFWPELERSVRIEGKAEKSLPNNPMPTSPVDHTPVASVLGQVNKVRSFPATNLYSPKPPLSPPNIRSTSPAHLTGAATSSPPTALNSGKADPAAYMTEFVICWKTGNGRK